MVEASSITEPPMRLDSGSTKMSSDTALTTQPTQPDTKRTHTIILDSSPLILNTPSISSLLSSCERIVTTQSVLSEIRDADARARIETTYRPFVTVLAAKPESIAVIKDFARRTGDLGALSSTDVGVLALAYDLECQLNGGDWRLRRVPGQKELNGPKPSPPTGKSEDDKITEGSAEASTGLVTETTHQVSIDELPSTASSTEPVEIFETIDAASDSDSDSGGWITPSNIKKHQAKDHSQDNKDKSQSIQVGTMTNDFAMQNVLLHMNPNLLSPTTSLRITVLRRAIMRCHGCFTTTKDMEKQFCASCGKPTLQRVNCSTNTRGQVRLHLKRNFQYNTKGNVYSVPKPTAGKSNQKWTGRQDGGGQKGWGRDLILAEDQKEYVRALSGAERRKGKDHNIMDSDYLPSILTGDRNGGGGRIRVGAGRSINSRKR